jgi:hypothetical protein
MVKSRVTVALKLTLKYHKHPLSLLRCGRGNDSFKSYSSMTCEVR